jgi:hypothetical protein
MSAPKSKGEEHMSQRGNIGRGVRMWPKPRDLVHERRQANKRRPLFNCYEVGGRSVLDERQLFALQTKSL